MFLPLLLRRLGFRRTLIFSGLAGGITLLLFVPLLDLELVRNFGQSVGLYFQKFEFNASIYYLIRWIGYHAVGYNIIGVAGKSLAGLTLLAILVLAWLEPSPSVRNLPRAMLWALAIYFALATTVHPWYSATLVALCGFTRYRFPIIWTALLPLTYYTYRTTAYAEHLGFVALEYLLVYGWVLWEFARENKVGKGFLSGTLFQEADNS
jgi:hypothetical protein